MDLTRLAAKQKRLQSWNNFVERYVKDEAQRSNFLSMLEFYKATLARCWKQSSIGAEDLHEIEDLERRLEALDELARLTVVPTKDPSGSNARG